MDNENKEVTTLYRVFKTVHEMLRDRGYNIGDDEININFTTFTNSYAPQGMVDRPAMSQLYALRESEGKKIYVYFTDEDNVSKKSIRQFIGVMEEKSAERGILLYKKKMTPAARKIMQELQGEYRIEEYPESDLVVNITRHFLVPKHSIMTDEEKKELLRRYRLRETQLPRILLSDPVARYYGLRRGQVMKIDRESETAGRYITYRIGL